MCNQLIRVAVLGIRAMYVGLLISPPWASGALIPPEVHQYRESVATRAGEFSAPAVNRGLMAIAFVQQAPGGDVNSESGPEGGPTTDNTARSNAPTGEKLNRITESGDVQTVPAALFAIRDSDGDRRLSLSEYATDRPTEEAEVVEKRFAAADADADGSLSPEEFDSPTIAKTDREWDFMRRDKSGNGLMDMEEFLASWDADPNRDVGKLRRKFHLRDLDDSGDLNYMEIRAGWSPLAADSDGGPVAIDLFERFDLDGNRELDVDEYRAGNRSGVRAESELDVDWFDEDGDGRLTPDDFRLTPCATPATADIEVAFGRLDKDHDGILTVDEFVDPLSAEREQEMRQRFIPEFDFNGDGALVFEEFQFTPAVRPDRETRFELRDTNGDGQLDAGEFAAFRVIADAERAQTAFGLLDENGDEYLSFAEYRFENAALAQVPESTSRPWGAVIGIGCGVIAVGFVWLALRRVGNQASRPKTTSPTSK